MKRMIVPAILIASFAFLPWWGTYILALFSLTLTSGFVGLLITIVLDFYSFPPQFPYLSLGYTVCMLLAYWVKQQLLDRASI